MAKRAVGEKNSTITRTTPAPAAEVERYCRGLADWPRSWMGIERDVPPGQQLVTYFRPFIEYLATSSDLSRKTIQKHVDNLWVLGGEIIRDLHETPSLRRKDAGEVLREVIGDDGGPLIHGGSSEQGQRQFDSTCRKLHRFLSHSLR